MNITFTNTDAVNAISVGRFSIAGGGTVVVDTNTCSPADLETLQKALDYNQVSCVTDVLIPQGLGGSGTYSASATYTRNASTIYTTLAGSGVQKQTAFSATPSFDLSVCRTVILAPLTANITSMTISAAPPIGSTVTFKVPASGVYTIAWPASFKKAADGAAASSKKGVTSFVYDGTNYTQVGGALAFN